jgi:hypothetical protein
MPCNQYIKKTQNIVSLTLTWKSKYILYTDECIVVGGGIVRLTPTHFCDCLKPGRGFPTSYIVVFFVKFVDIGGMDDHHCLTFLFITCVYIHYKGIRS